MGIKAKVLHAFRVSKGAKNLAHRPGLDVSDLKQLLSHRYPNHTGSFSLAVDVSHLAYQSADMSNSAYFVAQCLVTFAMAGFVVYPILDPDAGGRSHIKRDHTNRIFECQRSAVKSTKCRMEALSLRGGDETDKARAVDLMAESVKLEKKSRGRLPPGFEGRLRTHLQELCAHHHEADDSITPKEFDSGGQVQPIEVASFEADPNASRMIMDSVCHAIVGNDNDYGICLPPDACFLVSSFALRKERGKMMNRKELWKIQSIEVKSTGKWMDDAWDTFDQIWNSGCTTRVIYDKTQTPIFDSDNPRVRALAALMVGCDVLVGGADGVGPKYVTGLLEKFRSDSSSEAEVADSMLLAAKERLRMEEVEVDTFVTALLCIPANPTGTTVRRLYPDLVPRQFPLYLRDYADDEAAIVPGPSTLTCVGPTASDGQHIFMQCEGSKSCSSCGKDTCRTCTNEVSLKEMPISFLRYLVQKKDLDPIGDRATLISRLQPNEEVDPTTEVFLSAMKQTKADLQEMLGSDEGAKGLDKIGLVCRVVEQDDSSDEAILNVLKDLAPMKKEQLQEKIRQLNVESGLHVTTSGNKDDLIKRLVLQVEDPVQGVSNGVSSICSSCYQEEVFLPPSSGEVMSEEEMRKELKDAGVQLSSDASGFEVVDSFHMMEAVQELREDNSFEEVRFPEKSASALGKIGTTVTNFTFRDGAQFLHSTGVKEADILPLLGFLAQFLLYDDSKVDDFTTGKAYDSIPSFIKFVCFHSRATTGYRLIDRASRYALDPRAPPLLDQDVRMFRLDDGSIGFELQNEVPASMERRSFHKTKIALAPDRLIAASCGCTIGAEGIERITCPHCPPIMFQLTLLLTEGLAEQMVVEYGQRPNRERYEDSLSKEELTKLKYYLELFMYAAGSTSVNWSSGTTHAIDSFVVGTQKGGNGYGKPPSHLLIAARECDRRSKGAKAVEKTRELRLANNSIVKGFDVFCDECECDGENSRQAISKAWMFLDSASKEKYDEEAMVLNQLPDPVEAKPPLSRLERGISGTLPADICSFCHGMSTTHYCMSADESTDCLLIEGSGERKVCGRAICIICREMWSDSHPKYADLDESAKRYTCICHAGVDCIRAGKLRKKLSLPFDVRSRGNSWVHDPAYSTDPPELEKFPYQPNYEKLNFAVGFLKLRDAKQVGCKLIQLRHSTAEASGHRLSNNDHRARENKMKRDFDKLLADAKGGTRNSGPQHLVSLPRTNGSHETNDDPVNVAGAAPRSILSTIPEESEVAILPPTKPAPSMCDVEAIHNAEGVTINVTGGGDCLFAAVAQNLLQYEENIDHTVVRADICHAMENEWNESSTERKMEPYLLALQDRWGDADRDESRSKGGHDYDLCLTPHVSDLPTSSSDERCFANFLFSFYINKMKENGTWGGEPEIKSAAQKYERDIHVYENGRIRRYPCDGGEEEGLGAISLKNMQTQSEVQPIRVLRQNGNHFVAVFPVSIIQGGRAPSILASKSRISGKVASKERVSSKKPPIRSTAATLAAKTPSLVTKTQATSAALALSLKDMDEKTQSAVQKRMESRFNGLFSVLNIQVSDIFIRKERQTIKFGRLRLYLGISNDDAWLNGRQAEPGKTFVRPMFWNRGVSDIKELPTQSLLHPSPDLLAAYAKQLIEKEKAKKWEALAEEMLVKRILQHCLSPHSNEINISGSGGGDDSDDDSDNDDDVSNRGLTNEEIEALFNEREPVTEKRSLFIWDDESDEEDDYEPLRPGDEVEYDPLIFVAGSRKQLRATVISIDRSREPMLVLDNGENLPSDTFIRRTRITASGTNVSVRLSDTLCRGKFRRIECFELESGVLEGHSNAISAGFAKEANRVGGIIKRSMAKFHKNAQEDGFAPMDMMNRYKGINFDSDIPASTPPSANTGSVSSSATSLLGKVPSASEPVIVEDNLDLSVEALGTSMASLEKEGIAVANPRRKKTPYKYQLRERLSPALHNFEIINLAQRPKTSAAGSSPSLDDLKGGAWSDIDALNTIAALIFEDSIRNGKKNAGFLPACSFDAESVQNREIVRMDPSHRYCTFAFNTDHWWCLDILPKVRIIVEMQGLNNRDQNEIEGGARYLLRKYGLDKTKKVEFQHLSEAPDDRRIKRFSFPAIGDGSVWMVISSRVFNKLVANANCQLYKLFALRPEMIQQGSSACGFFALSGLQSLLALEDGDPSHFKESNIVLEGDEDQRTRMLRLYEELFEARKRDGSLVPCGRSGSLHSAADHTSMSSQSAEIVTLDDDVDPDDTLPAPFELCENTGDDGGSYESLEESQVEDCDNDESYEPIGDSDNGESYESIGDNLSHSDLNLSGLEGQFEGVAKQLDDVLGGLQDAYDRESSNRDDDFSVDSDPDIDTRSLAKQLSKAEEKVSQELSYSSDESSVEGSPDTRDIARKRRRIKDALKIGKHDIARLLTNAVERKLERKEEARREEARREEAQSDPVPSAEGRTPPSLRGVGVEDPRNNESTSGKERPLPFRDISNVIHVNVANGDSSEYVENDEAELHSDVNTFLRKVDESNDSAKSYVESLGAIALDEILIHIGAGKRGKIGTSVAPKKKKIMKWINAPEAERSILFRPKTRKKKCCVPGCTAVEDGSTTVRIMPVGWARDTALEKLNMTGDKRSELRFCDEHFEQAKPPESDTPSQKPSPKAKHHCRCAFSGCFNTDATSGVKFFRIPPPAGDAPKNARRESVETFYTKKKHRETMMNILGRKKNDTSSLRVCSDHNFVERELEVKIPTKKGKYRNHKFAAFVLSSDGVKKALNQPSRGMARDRAAIAAFQAINTRAENGGDGTKEAIEEADEASDVVSSFSKIMSVCRENLPPELLESLDLASIMEKAKKVQSNCEKGVDRVRELEKSDAQNTKLITLMGHEQGTPGKKKENRPVNSGLAEVAGIIKTPPKPRLNKSAFYRRKPERKKKGARDLPPHVEPGNDASVKRRTGFISERHMLLFIIVVCNGDLDLVATTVTCMTWYEEWFFTLEWINGKTLTRWEDAEDQDTGYGMAAASLYKVFRSKLRLILICRLSWPAHAFCEEDWELRREKWDMEGYSEMRVLLTDDTGIPLAFQPSDAGLQSATHSLYYSCCCLKGAVTVQFCGFIRTLPLFAGATSDSEYDKKNGSAQLQRRFAENDRVDGRLVPFTHIKDKGYRTSQELFREGGQLTLRLNMDVVRWYVRLD